VLILRVFLYFHGVSMGIADSVGGGLVWTIVLKPGPARRVDPGPGRSEAGTGPG